MYKKLFSIALTVLLAVASIVYAAGMQVNSSAVPVSGGSIFASGQSTAPKGINTSSTFINYSVAANGGWSLSSVQIDGIAASADQTIVAGSSYKVAYDTSKVHTIKANFAQTLYSIATSAGANGTVLVTGGGNVNIAPGANRSVVVAPATGYKIASLLVDGAVVNPSDATVAFTKAYTNIQGNKSVSATFALLPAATAYAGINKTVGGTSTVLTGSVTSNSTPSAYLWQVTGPAGASFSDATVLSPTLNFSALGSYNVTLTAIVGGQTFTSAPATITVIGAGAVASNPCMTCHAGTVADNYPTSIHAQSTHSTCAACHNGASHNSNNVNADTVDPATFVTVANNSVMGQGVVFCTKCHAGAYAIPHPTNLNAGITCAKCHTDPLGQGNGTGDAHSIQALPKCIECHAVAQAQVAPSLVNDNNGVRAITTEFAKWSHHVTGTTLQDAHCAACHLEGKVEGTEIVVDSTKHMVDNKIHLRNADTDADMAWDPAAPNFSTIDNFCLSCHDSNGATSTASAAIQAIIVPAAGKTASATNPFGDTISNQYDMLQRPAVVDAASQFATGNPSHHAVLGQKYTGRTRSGATRVIADVAGFTSNSSASLPGARSTIYDAGKFQADYATLSPAPGTTDTSLGDDSVLHCADCHTVGQYSASAPGYGGRYNNAVIGAHGANNEYLLRNNAGTDARHRGTESSDDKLTITDSTKPYLVCFNCHAFATYGSIGQSTGIAGMNHAGEYANTTRCNGPQNTIFGNMTGEARLTSVSTKTSTLGARTTTTFGNAFGIQCNNCHNSGTTAGNIFGGIHGAKDQTYTDGMGNTTKHVRFMPGLGNVMYVPGTKGGFSGGSLAAYNSYSGNRNGTGTGLTVGQTFTTLPYRTIVPGVSPAASTKIDGKDVPSQVMPYNNALPTTGIKTGSYQYTTGGISSDLNWEQKSAQPVAGEFDFQAKSMGCYTLAPSAVKVVGQNGDANKYPASNNIQAGAAGPNGTTTMFDNWGGCDDHNGAQGAGTAPFRKVLRKVTY